jgi:hypothetical protein
MRSFSADHDQLGEQPATLQPQLPHSRELDDAVEISLPAQSALSAAATAAAHETQPRTVAVDEPILRCSHRISRPLDFGMFVKY